MTEDAELLGRYAAERSETDFEELTRRHVDLVYSAALRVVHGDAHAAEDVTQQVFTEAARQAKRLARHPALVGWLYTTTRLVALRVNRTEQRRRAREQEANAMNQLLHDDSPAPDWDQLRPVIEDAMHELDEKDRHAVLLRFFQNKSLSEVGGALNLTENAARMRVERALQKLRGKLARRGVCATAAALAAMVSANAVQAAPAGFATALCAAALAGSAQASSLVAATTQTIAMTTLQKTVVVAALAAAVGTGIYAVHNHSKLNARIQALGRQQAPLAAQVRQLEEERSEASTQVAALRDENARLKSGKNSAELLKLRGEVGALRQRTAASEAKASQPGGLASMLNDPGMKELVRQGAMDRMKSLYADLIEELKLTPEQSEQFLELLGNAATKNLALLAAPPGAPRQPGGFEEAGTQLHALLGTEGCARFKEYSEEMPARATVKQLNSQLGTPLSAEQRASLIQIIKAEPTHLTQGVLGGPDPAFAGTQAEIDDFLQQVSLSNERILQQAGAFLTPRQSTALDSLLAKGIEARKAQGSAFFQKQ